MENYKIKHVDLEDLEDLLVEVEASFGIQIADGELAHITTFGQLFDYIVNKIQLEDTNDCTTQQAFYKLREAITATLGVDGKTIVPNILASEVFPRQDRRLKVRHLENHLGMKLRILRPPNWVTSMLLIAFFASILGFFVNVPIGLLGLTLSIAGFWLAGKFGNELGLQTIGQVAQEMATKNYLKSRRNPNTANPKEIKEILVYWFGRDLGLPKAN